ncbi:MAG: IS110 family transposase [Promethearchaeota archaeon]|nr:MAG: IS110 family transposase [Candidatus Lokiarchaeota archaeon]
MASEGKVVSSLAEAITFRPEGEYKMELVEFKVDVDWRTHPFFCGLDVHKHELAVTICTAEYRDAKVVSRSIFSVNSEGLEQFWNYVKKYQPAGFAMEATGIFHHWIHKFLMQKLTTVDWHAEMIITNPSDAHSLPGRPKDDKIDSESLAKYLAKGMLRCGKPIIEVQEDLKAIFRMILRIEKDRTALKNRIIKTLDRAGIRPKRMSLNMNWVCRFLYYFTHFQGTLGAFLDEIFTDGHPLEPQHTVIKKNIGRFQPFSPIALTHIQRTLIRQDLIELDFKTGRKDTLTIEIGHIIEQYPHLRHHASNLASIPGLSKVKAVWILAEIGSLKQYPTSRKFAAYCGCCPRIVSSAGKVYSAHTMRHSNKYLRTIFYNAAIVICNLLKQDSELKRYATRTIQRKGRTAFKLAVCTVATKLTKITYAILRDGKPFDPEHSQKLLHPLKKDNEQVFTLVEKKIIRHARNVLKRVSQMENTQDLGILGEDLSIVAEHLDSLLEGKKII